MNFIKKNFLKSIFKPKTRLAKTKIKQHDSLSFPHKQVYKMASEVMLKHITKNQPKSIFCG